MTPKSRTPLVLAALPDKGDLDSLCALARSLGYTRVRTVRDSAEACEVLRRERVSIVIAPRLEGEWMKLRDAACERKPAPKLIVCLNFSRFGRDEADAEIELGASDVLAKPFRAEEVRQALGFASQHT
jgi:CheY-like chemotaxis protein